MAFPNETDSLLGIEPRRRALLVEDEVLIRIDIAETLRENGWEVIEARTADDAIELLSRDSDFQLLLTDVHMPGIKDGLHLARLAKELSHIKVAVMSGGHLPRPEDERPFDIFLPKPIGDLLKELSPLLSSFYDGKSDT